MNSILCLIRRYLMVSLPIVFHPDYIVEFSGETRFPLQKYQELRNVLEQDNLLRASNLFVPQPIHRSAVELTHDKFYVERVLYNSLSPKEKREIGLPNIKKFCERAFISSGGTLLAARLALKFGFAANAAGGSHHAASFRGSGFCIFNDVAITVNCLLKERKVSRVIILDLDVHQGDGTAEIFQSEDRVFTVSMHCQKNFPVKKVTSNLDVGLKAGTGDRNYIVNLSKVIGKLEKIPADLVIYNAGIDVHEDDILGHLNLSDFGIMEREKMVLDFILKRKLPFVVTLGGGYQKNVANLANLHSMIFREVVSRL
jgi:acetoin utilization deacetylase AcuC-like enzyme